MCACLAFAVLACAVLALVVGLGCLSADAASTLSVDPDPAGTAQSAAASLASSGGEKDAQSEDASADATSHDDEVAPQASAQSGSFTTATRSPFTFECHVLVNGEWKYVTTDGKVASYIPATSLPTTTLYNPTWAGNGRLYVTGAFLESVYGPLFGFEASDLIMSASSYNGNSFFGVSDRNTVGTIWNDLAPWYTGSISGFADGKCDAAAWAVPLVADTASNRAGNGYLYYLPANASGASSYFITSKKLNDAQLIADNTFYSIDVADNGNLIYGQDEQLPETSYVLAGHSRSVTVKAPAAGSNAKWVCISNNAEVTPASTTTSADGSLVTMTFEDLRAPISIMSAREGQVTSTATFKADTLSESLVKLGDCEPTSQSMVSDGQVKGKGSVTLALSGDGSLTTPLMDSGHEVVAVERMGGGSKNRHFYYHFVGWEVVTGGQSHVFAAGETISAASLAVLDPSGTGLTFKAKWSAQDDDTKRIQAANFFVNIKFEIADNMGNGFSQAPASDFTDAIFSTRVNGGEGLKGNAANNGCNNANDLQLLAPPTQSSTAYAVDSILRKMVSTPYVPEDKSLYSDGFAGITLDAFPTDVAVLEAVRNSGKTLTEGGKTVDPATITPDNYAVRWYSFKYGHSDGWHVDGVLVRKEGRLTVTKTFAGDPTAVSQAKENFSIAVSHGAIEDYVLNLRPYDADSNKNGYTSYDAATDTYTWSISARQGTTYTIGEKNYTLDANTWSSGCWYKVLNSDAQTDGWLPLGDNSVKVVAQSYGADVPDSACQTVAFRNVYAKSDVVRLSKVDSVTGNPISGVTFTFMREADQTSVQLYQKNDGSNFYSIYPNEEFSKVVSDGKVTTGSDGSVYLTVGKSQTGVDSVYRLVEDVPVGYRGLYGVRVTVNMVEGSIRHAEEIDASGAEVSGSAMVGVSADGKSLVVKNNSEVLTSVCAAKNWGSTPESQRKPVTVSLWRNGAKLVGDKYTQVLSANNDWNYVWYDLPLFIDGQLAQYTLREDKIGDTDYDASAGSDGYADYLVTQDSARYSDSSASARPEDYTSEPYWQDGTGQWHYATHAILVLNNLPTTGDLAFSKCNGAGEPLADALFYLYADEGRTEVKQSARSDASGYVVFSGLREGTYWVKEREAPKGYELDQSVYKVVVSGGNATMTRVGDETATPVTEVRNYFKATLSVHKMNSQGGTLPGATIELRSIGGAGEETVVDTQVTNEGGVAIFEHLGAGRYVIVETGAPAGYSLPEEDDCAFVTVEEGDISFGRSSGSSWKYYDGLTIDEGAIFVTDTPLYNLPTAGGPGIFAMGAGGVALMCGAAWLWLRRRRGGADA